MSSNVQAILMVVRQVPKGRVATYGQVARIAGIPRNARQVGSVLAGLSAENNGGDVPWHRIVNSKGEISDRGCAEIETLQRQALEDEEVRFTASGRISLAEFQWQP